MKTYYDSETVRPPVIDELLGLWRYRDLLKLLITNSIKTRYKRSVLGVAWTLLNPLLNTVVLTIAFSQLLRFQVENYAIYILVGLIFWNFFAQTTAHSMNTLIWGSGLLKRIYLPKTIFAVSVVGNGIINFLLSLVPLAVIMVVMRHPFANSLVLLPFAIILLAVFTLGISLLISTLAVFFVDVVDMYSVLLSAWFYLTPIIYPMSIVPEKYLRILELNPLVTMLSLFRKIIYLGVAPSSDEFVISIILSLFSFCIGWWLFTKKVDEFAYRI